MSDQRDKRFSLKPPRFKGTLTPDEGPIIGKNLTDEDIPRHRTIPSLTWKAKDQGIKQDPNEPQGETQVSPELIKVLRNRKWT